MADILLLADTFVPNRGGSEAYLAVLAEGLAQNGHRVTVVTPASKVTGPMPKFHPGVLIRRSRLWQRLHILGSHPNAVINRLSRLAIFPLLAARLFRKRADVVIAGHILPAGVVARFLVQANRCKASVVVTYGEELTMYRRSARMLNLMRKALQGADAVTALTNDSREELDLIYPGAAAKTFVIPPSVKVNDDHDKPDGAPAEIKAGRPNLFTLSRIVERKGMDTTIRAVAALRDEFPDIQYHIAGTGPDSSRLHELIKELQLEDCVHLHGSVPDPKLYFQTADIFCMPNRELANGEREGFGIVFLEAGLYGVPSIAGRSGGAVDAVLHDETGLLVEPDNAEAMADAIRILTLDETYRKNLGQAARAYAEQFTAERQVSKFMEIIQQLLDPAKSPR